MQADRFGSVAAKLVAAAIAGLVILFLLIVALGWLSAFERTQAGEVAIIRNGGLFDNKKIRGYMPEASDRQNIGLWSEAHKYPAQQRFYKISSNASESDSGLVDRVQVPTSDGVLVDIEGTVYFRLNTDERVLRDFDNKFGTRTFGGKHPYDGDEGFSNFLNTIIRPVIDNNLRKEIGSVRGAEINPSLALVQNQGDPSKVNKAQGQLANERVRQVEQTVNAGLAADIEDQLGGDYLVDIKFTLNKVVPPPAISEAINKAQAAFAGVTQAQGRLRAAEIDAKANQARQKGYEGCPACAAIDQLKAIPENVKTFAPGQNFAITP
jgi:regulator of protease activity HflC (stomatin/prohibitin superfamily)